ncbi:MAG: hypothetical protein JXR73_20045 [Candidatus Omnitrophica bacterium]|nr:hypothetical protein [Candidatus Omnitrophota bacterium]
MSNPKSPSFYDGDVPFVIRFNLYEMEIDFNRILQNENFFYHESAGAAEGSWNSALEGALIED